MLHCPETTPKYFIDIGRPNILDETREQWLEFSQWIIDCDIPITVSSAFNFVREYCVNGESYIGGGYKFMFWFEKEKDKAVFISKYDEIFPGDLILYESSYFPPM